VKQKCKKGQDLAPRGLLLVATNWWLAVNPNVFAVAAQRRAVAVAAEERISGAEDGEAGESEKGPGDGHGPLVAEEDGNTVMSAGPGPGSRNLGLQLKLWLKLKLIQE